MKIGKMNDYNRVLYFDAIKLFAIVIVLYGHCVQHLISNGETTPIYIFIYSFHMPLFMIISGFFSHSVMNLKWNDVIKKKSKQLILPCIIGGGVILVLRYLFEMNISLSYAFRNDLWFLKSLFCCIVLTYIAMRIKPPYRFCLLMLFIVITQISLFRLKDMFPCFLFGYYFKTYYLEVIKYKYIILLLCALLYLILGFNYLDASFLQVTRDNLLHYVSKELIILLMGISASVSIILIFHRMEKILNQKICRIGMLTLEIYVCQSIFLESILSHFLCYDGINQVITYAIIFPTIIALTLMITVGYVKIQKVVCRRFSFQRYAK